jgi:PAS domain S-box-containing protein
MVNGMKGTAMFEKANDNKALLEQKDKELQECKACLRTILTRSVHGVLIVDKSRTILFANPVAEGIFNAKEKGLPGRPFEYPMTSGETKELNVRSRDGKTVAVEMWMLDIEWDGKPASFISLHDITERRRNEQELRKLYRAVMASPSMVMITDARGDIEYINPKFTEVTGYAFNEVAGRNPRFLQSGKMPPEEYQRLWETIARGEEWRGEFINRKKNGELYQASVAIAPVTDFEGTITHFVAVEEDITTRKLTEEALAISETRYRRLFEKSKDGILILDADSGQIADVNPFLVEMLGYSREEFRGKKLWEIGAFADTEASKAAFEALQQKEYLRYEDLPLQTRDGRLIEVEFVSNVYTVDRKQVIQCNIRDITAHKRAEKEIEILNTTLAARAYELETVNQELEAFSHTVSHDLRRPLTGINGYCQIVQESCSANLDEQCRGYLQEIYDGTLRMNKLIDTLLNFALLTRSELYRETVDLSGIARAVAAELKMGEPGRKVTFNIVDGLTVNGDPKLLHVVLENLFGNAWKYSSKQEDAVIEFGVAEVDGKPAYFVRDNGSGFDMAHSDKLFTPFQRLPGTSEYTGHGIGLATVQRIVQRHDGRVWAKGEVGKGATFYFSLA